MEGLLRSVQLITLGVSELHWVAYVAVLHGCTMSSQNLVTFALVSVFIFR
jgi:hypothetical protein